MIELKVPANAVRGSLLSGSYSITGEEFQLLKDAREVRVELKCSIDNAKARIPAGNTGFEGVAFELYRLHDDLRVFGKDASGNFEFDLPADLPATYGGKLIQVNWTVTAIVDLPMKMDKRNECRIVVG